MQENETVKSSKPLHSMTVLVVDQVDNMRSIISAILTEMGISRVITASHGTQAVQLLSVTSVDLIISEAQLAKLSGLELLQHVRSNEALAKVPFIMLSSSLEQSSVMQAIENGVNDYIGKPFSGRILQSRIARALGPQALKTNVATASDTKAKSDQLSVLVVDDAPDNIQLISDILKKSYTVKAATSGETALKICMAEPQPDLVLLDIMMPGMDGFEVCRRLKANPDTQHIPVIFLTAMNNSESIVKGLELGAVDYITKPINPPVMQARVKTHCKTVQDQNALRMQLDLLMQNSQLKQEVQSIAKQSPQKITAMLFDALDKIKQVSPSADEPIQTAKKAAEQLSNMLANLAKFATKSK